MSENGSVPADDLHSLGLRDRATRIGLAVGDATHLDQLVVAQEELEGLLAKVAEENGTKAAPAQGWAPVTAKDLCAIPAPTTDGLLGPLVVRGQRLVIGGATGSGKTTLVSRLVKAITEGADFLEWTGAGEGHVLVIDAEQGLRTIQRRLRECDMAGSEAVSYLRVPDGLSLEDDTQASELEAVLAERDWAAVVADPLYKLHRGDSNDERAATDLMRRFDGWRERFGFALIVPVHTRKRQPGSSGFSIDDLFGSGAYTRGAEVVVGLQLLRPGYSRLHYFKDREGDLPLGQSWGLLFSREEGYRRDPEDEKPKETAAERIGRALEADPVGGLTLEQAAKAGDCSDRTARTALKQLAAVDSSGLHGIKTWRLPTPEQEGLDL